MPNVNFRPIFPSPLGYVNFGEGNRDLNKRLIEDIETEMSESDGKTKTFRKNNMSWQSFPRMERKYSSFEELRLYISDSAKPILHESGVSRGASDLHRTEGLWANVVLGAGGYSRPHLHGHGRTLWSGVYYPKGLQGDENFRQGGCALLDARQAQDGRGRHDCSRRRGGRVQSQGGGAVFAAEVYHRDSQVHSFRPQSQSLGKREGRVRFAHHVRGRVH